MRNFNMVSSSGILCPSLNLLLEVSAVSHSSIFCCCCSLITKPYPILCDPIDCSMPCFPVFHYLSEFTQIHVHCVGDAIYLISSSCFSFCLQSFLASGSFPMSWLLCLTVCLYHTISKCVAKLQ